MTDRRRCGNVLSHMRSGADRLTRSPTYDVAMRIPIVVWATALAIRSAAGLEQYVRAADPALPNAVFAVEIAMRLSVIAYLVILVPTVVMRSSPIGRSRGAEPRISAFVGTFLITAVTLFPRNELSLVAELGSAVLITAGDAFAVIALTQLRRSFSIMPEARELVTSGLYRFVRHPLYLAEAVVTIGIVGQFLSVWTLMLLLVQFLFQFRRIMNEETILMEAFPQFAIYKKKTARLIPGIY
jgi:protein-S-isoprenylcysteine O-methyltransferase Ste14